MNIFLYIHLSLVLAAVPITQQVTSKFKLSQTPQNEEPAHHQQSHLQSINDKVMKYNKLGSNYDLIVDQVKAQKVPEKEVQASDKIVSFATSTSSSVPESSAPVVADFEIKSSRSFISDFFKFKAHEFQAQSAAKEGNPSLRTSIKNYDNALNHPYDLKFFTNKVVQETKEETDFPDYNFKQYGHTAIPYSKNNLPSLNTIDFVPKLDMPDFVSYLKKFEGFKDKDLKFLTNSDDGLDYGLDEIEDQLNRIKDKEREERKIDIDGENSGTRSFKSSMLLILVISFYLL